MQLSKYLVLDLTIYIIHKQFKKRAVTQMMSVTEPFSLVIDEKKNLKIARWDPWHSPNV